LNAAGVLLDTGPLVALLSRDDVNHQRARELIGSCLAPLRTCEAVIAEAGFLLRKVHPLAPVELIRLGERGVFEIGISLADHWGPNGKLLDTYRDRPNSLADASLIRSAEIHDEPRILTFDADFAIYRWGRRKRFEIL
jgi:predicted nucleic acid-binding protein